MTTYRLFPSTNGPAADSVDSNANLCTEFYVTSAAWATQLLFYRPVTNSMVAPVTGILWQVSGVDTGVEIARATFTLSGTGWQVVDLPVPIALTPNQRYRVGYHTPTDYPATSLFWSTGSGSAGITNGILVAPSAANSTGADQSSYSYGTAGTYPVNSFNATNYWADVTVDDVEPSILQQVKNSDASEDMYKHLGAMEPDF